MNTGILLLLVGSNRTYQHWAENLVTSIRHYSPDLPITIVTSGMYLQPMYSKGVTYITCPAEHYTDNGKFAPGKAKLHLNLYTPYERTIYLDVDGIACGPLEDVSPMFGEIGAVSNEFTPVEADKWKCQWMSLADVRKTYTIPEGALLPEINSSLLVWTKSETTDKFFEQARANFIPAFKGRVWGNTFPDELAFNVAFAQLGLLPCEAAGTPEPIVFNIGWKGWSTAGEAINAGVRVLGMYGETNSAFKRQYQAYDAVLSAAHKAVHGCWPPLKSHQLMKSKFIRVNK
jgi:hypothetical protein